MRDVSSLTNLAEPPALDGLGEDHRGRAAMLDRRLVGGIHLLGIVAAAAHLAQLRVGQILDHLQQLRMRAEEMLADVVARLDRVLLIVPVERLRHAADEQAFVVACE